MRKTRTIDEYEFESFNEIFKFLEEEPMTRHVVYRDDCYVKNDGGDHYYIDMDDHVINLENCFDENGNVIEELMRRAFSIYDFTGREYTLYGLDD